jgi:hypothetical protein
MIIPRWILRIMRNVSGQNCRENQNTNFVFNAFFRISCHLWDNVGKCCRPKEATKDNIIRRMHFECWVTKATDTHSEYVILIAFPRQQWLRERTSMLRHTYMACHVTFMDINNFSAMNVFVFCRVIPCSLVGIYWRSGGSCYEDTFVCFLCYTADRMENTKTHYEIISVILPIYTVATAAQVFRHSFWIKFDSKFQISLFKFHKLTLIS